VNTPRSLAESAVNVLTTANPSEKVESTYLFASQWRRGDFPVGESTPPTRPARPAKPMLCAPGEMPKRSTGPKGRIALVHALAHIELNAIDLAWDIIARFTGHDLPKSFYDDWVEVAEEEAKHFEELANRLRDLDVTYGDLPAHDGLWEAAEITSKSLPARLALIPMTLEARGIDTTPNTIERLKRAGDEKTVAVLSTIYNDEIKHLTIGVRWFEYISAKDKFDSPTEYKRLLGKYFRGTPKGPFNLQARERAGMNRRYLEPWM